jgi:hypothetical protein
MGEGQASPPAYTLRRVASIVLALVSLLPLLLFVYALYELKALARPLARMSELLRAAATGAGAAGAAAGASSPAVPQAGFEIPGMGRVGEAHAFLEPVQQLERLGTVWRAEAEPYVGQRVLVSVMNAAEPIAGVLTRVTDDGLLLDQDGQRVGITYRRISAIEPDRDHAEPAGAV